MVDKPKGLLQRAAEAKMKPRLPPGVSPTHQVDNVKLAKQLEKARGKARFNPDDPESQGELERTFMVSRTFAVYREALKWLKLAAVDIRGKRVKKGERRWVDDPGQVEADLRRLKAKVESELAAAPETPESLYELLDTAESLVEHLRP